MCSRGEDGCLFAQVKPSRSSEVIGAPPNSVAEERLELEVLLKEDPKDGAGDGLLLFQLLGIDSKGR